MPLIEKIFAATQSGDLLQPFTVDHLKDWMTKMQIVKDDGNPYAQSSIDAILSNSDTKNIPTSNKMSFPLFFVFQPNGIMPPIVAHAEC